MITFSEPTVEDYVRALSELPEKNREILVAQCTFPGRSASARQLASAVGYQGYGGANSLYGNTAKMVCEFLHLEKPKEGDWSQWWPTLAEGDGSHAEFHWVMRKKVAGALEKLGWVRKPSVGVTIFSDEYSDSDEYSEGKLVSVRVNIYERSRKAREACIRHHGDRCAVCQFDFGTAYGQIGAGFTHVHHLKPLGQIGEEYVLDPINDLRPVCPNCHAMLHRREPPFTIEDLKAQLQGTSPSIAERAQRVDWQRVDEILAKIPTKPPLQGDE